MSRRTDPEEGPFDLVNVIVMPTELTCQSRADCMVGFESRSLDYLG